MSKHKEKELGNAALMTKTEMYIDQSWQREQTILMALETGNREMIEELLTLDSDSGGIAYHYGNPVIEGDTIRELKNGMIIQNTLCRIAAEKGGVPPRYLYNLSEKYILLIEHQIDPDVLNEKIGTMMLKEYLDLVLRLSVKSYTELIKSVANYISENIQESLSLSKIADHFHVNPSHLSREFKKETMVNLTDYINQQKINLAKLFLLQNDHTIMDVSDMLNYNSSSYFSKTFKKVTGISPKEYKNQLMNI